MQLLYQPKFSSFTVLRKTFFEVPTHFINAKAWYECEGGRTVPGEMSNHEFNDTHKGKSI